MVWTAPAPHPADGPMTGSDRPMLEAYLAWQRATLLNICADLTADQLAIRPLPSSNLSLLGLVRHMAKVERIWFRQRAAAIDDLGGLYDPSLGKDYDFDHLDPAGAEAAFQRYGSECRQADDAVAGLSFDHTFEVHGEPFSLRMTYVHMVGEYARHNGHADLLREAIDGTTGR
ncbi:MAG: hypothetical protein JWM76_2484 [Pseudonocardiales bacterium]|nr:hypothetical protein [Pseudonocardiales bacterium]